MPFPTAAYWNVSQKAAPTPLPMHEGSRYGLGRDAVGDERAVEATELRVQQTSSALSEFVAQQVGSYAREVDGA